jgi:hypothetical protein
MAGSSEPAFLFFARKKGADTPAAFQLLFATAPLY